MLTLVHGETDRLIGLADTPPHRPQARVGGLDILLDNGFSR
jgi:hypothetical protein